MRIRLLNSFVALEKICCESRKCYGTRTNRVSHAGGQRSTVKVSNATPDYIYTAEWGAGGRGGLTSAISGGEC